MKSLIGQYSAWDLIELAATGKPLVVAPRESTGFLTRRLTRADVGDTMTQAIPLKSSDRGLSMTRLKTRACLTLLALIPLGMSADDFYGEIKGLTLAKPEDAIDTPSTPPPPGSIVLLDGKSLESWVGKDGSPAKWTLLPTGAMQVMKGDIVSKEKFDGHFKLHVEFRVPYMPESKGQGRGNSGIYLQGRYEVQILDSYGLESQDNDCGGIYKVAIPLINACKAPTVWQAYDIDFTAPEFVDGKKVAPAKISVVQNGQTIHKDVMILIDNTVSGMGGDPGTPGPIMLQDHGNPVQYRNIWLVRL